MGADAESGARAQSPEQHFASSELAGEVYARVAAIIEELGGADIRVSQSQVAFHRRRGFAYVWTPPGRNPATSPAILSIAFSNRIVSDRFRDAVQPRPNIWQHHLWITDPAEIDDEVRGWLEAAYVDAAPRA